MKLFATTLQAIDPTDGQLKTFMGEFIPAFTETMARDYCTENGLGYLSVIGEVMEVIDDQKELSFDLRNCGLN